MLYLVKLFFFSILFLFLFPEDSEIRAPDIIFMAVMNL